MDCGAVESKFDRTTHRIRKQQKNQHVSNYIDGYAFPIATKHLETYKSIAAEIAAIWKEYGALSYSEFVSDGPTMEGTRSFSELLDAKDDETIIFGWVAFESKEAHTKAHQRIANDSRMAELVAPLMESSNLIFDAQRMGYGCFSPIIQS